MHSPEAYLTQMLKYVEDMNDSWNISTTPSRAALMEIRGELFRLMRIATAESFESAGYGPSDY